MAPLIRADRPTIPSANGGTFSLPARAPSGGGRDTAYGAWRDAGLVMMDVSDRTAPRLIAHRNWSPPYGGDTHNCLPLSDRQLMVVADEVVLDNKEDGIKYIRMFNIRE